MKYIIIISLLISLLFMAVKADEVIDTPYGKKTVIIPTDTEKLKQNYIELSKMYFSQKYDLDKATKDVQGLITEAITPLEKRLRELQSKYDSLVISYNELSKTIGPYYSVIYGYWTYDFTKINSNPIKLGIGYNGYILNTFMIGGGFIFPDQLIITAGIKF